MSLRIARERGLPLELPAVRHRDAGHLLPRAGRPSRNGGGSIVNLGSASGTGGQARFAAYAFAKEAVRGMSKAALKWGRDDIRVGVVCPFADSEGMQA
jgi:NAD(P)-dependent dehydrogenase (short-subunit alcohol dehydrogenase family)